jgi:anti-anti-sigma regulatory factor
MTTNPVSPVIDGRAELLVRAALEQLDSDPNGSVPELVLDFSAVGRIHPAALQALEQLAAKARDRSVKVVLRGVNVDVYKVLILSALSAQFAFLD